MTATKPLRLLMPLVTDFIDACRAAFGRELVDSQIRSGMIGGTDFWASENGHQVGHRPQPPQATFTADQLQLKPRKDAP